MEPVGYTWLIDKFALSTTPLSHASYIGSRSRLETAPSAPVVVEQFQPNYYPGDTPLDHVEFALKYDDLNLDLLRQLFYRLQATDVAAYIDARPAGKYARQIGFLYEFLTSEQLVLSRQIGGNYTDLLDPGKYVTAPTVKNARWRINDNLLGSSQFCPIVRVTESIRIAAQADFSARLKAFRSKVPPELFQRAIDYLYFKETRSSYNIERETTTPEREERFVAVLKNAGHNALEEVMSEKHLTQLQNLIAEPRYAQAGFRTWQNYVGESPPSRSPIIHYICPPGDSVNALMSGLLACAQKSAGIHPVVRAAVVAFGFVFIHPFEDGNGRIHRYLIHDFLGRDGLVPEGMILPVSAYMLHHSHEYDRTLENYSKPLKRLVRYTLNEDEVLTITNPNEAAGYYQYPDLTAQVSYLFHAVEQTINTELVAEILFIRNYDAAREAIRDVIDLPDRKLDQIIKFLHQNNGRLSKAKRRVFEELDDEEIQRIEEEYQRAFTVDETMDFLAGTAPPID
jgi:hypothetical protein